MQAACRQYQTGDEDVKGYVFKWVRRPADPKPDNRVEYCLPIISSSDHTDVSYGGRVSG